MYTLQNLTTTTTTIIIIRYIGIGSEQSAAGSHQGQTFIIRVLKYNPWTVR